MIFLLADAPTPSPESGIEQFLLMIGVAVFFFYFILYRPEQKRRKELDNKRNSLKKGDSVIIAGGIIAEVVKLEKHTAIVRLEDGAKMKVLRLAIQDVYTEQTPSC